MPERSSLNRAPEAHRQSRAGAQQALAFAADTLQMSIASPQSENLAMLAVALNSGRAGARVQNAQRKLAARAGVAQLEALKTALNSRPGERGGQSWPEAVSQMMADGDGVMQRAVMLTIDANAEAQLLNAARTVVRKRTQLRRILNNAGRSAVDGTIRGYVLDESIDYYQARIADPANLDQVNGWIDDLENYRDGNTAWNGITVVARLNSIDQSLVEWRRLTINAEGGVGGGQGPRIDVRRIENFPGLRNCYVRVSAGFAADPNGVNYNDHGFGNAQNRLPGGQNYRAFDWIDNGARRGARRGVYDANDALYVTADHYEGFIRVITPDNLVAPPPPMIRER